MCDFGLKIYRYQKISGGWAPRRPAEELLLQIDPYTDLWDTALG